MRNEKIETNIRWHQNELKLLDIKRTEHQQKLTELFKELEELK